LSIGLPSCHPNSSHTTVRRLDAPPDQKAQNLIKIVSPIICFSLAAMIAKIPEDKAGKPNGRRRALLDSNIWRYVTDNNAEGSLLRLARDGSYNVQIAPSVLYEALRLKDASLRATLVRLMTNSRFHRLLPEAYSESMEVLREIERARPEWLRDAPDLRFFNRLKKDWTRRTGGFWVRCERSPQSEARYVAELWKERKHKLNSRERK
jgi:hypothetical protein